jgi:MFS family permease
MVAMKTLFTLFSGIFSVMALSNAIVPVLPKYSGSSSMQGAIYAAYFLGAFMSTLPTGILSDRYGRLPFIRAGLVITVASGFLLSLLSLPYAVLTARFIEGIGGGCFVAAAISYVNSRPDHEQMSGYFMALLNWGLVIGLILAGWLGARPANPANGILVFSVLAILPACMSLVIPDPGHGAARTDPAVLTAVVRDYRWLWFSSIILVGITGVVSSLYPKFSGASPDSLGFWIAGMSIATIGAVLVMSRLSLPPVLTIRISAILMAAGVMISFYSTWGFPILGALAGFVMIAQMAVLAGVGDNQGMAMGLFTTTSYLGMTILPFIAGLFADTTGFFSAFAITALSAVLVAILIGRNLLPGRAQ